MKLLIALALAAAPSALAMAPYVPDDEGPTAAPTLDPTPGPTPGPTPQPTPGPTPFELPDPGSGYTPITTCSPSGPVGCGVCHVDLGMGPVDGIASIEYINTGSCFPFDFTDDDFFDTMPNCRDVACKLQRPFEFKKNAVYRIR